MLPGKHTSSVMQIKGPRLLSSFNTSQTTWMTCDEVHRIRVASVYQRRSANQFAFRPTHSHMAHKTILNRYGRFESRHMQDKLSGVTPGGGVLEVSRGSRTGFTHYGAVICCLTSLVWKAWQGFGFACLHGSICASIVHG